MLMHVMSEKFLPTTSDTYHNVIHVCVHVLKKPFQSLHRAK